jgi:hypothetical protein
MTFAQFKAAVYAETIPDKESSRLNARHEGWLKSALIELQQKVMCLQANHREYITQDATYYSCGASAFAIPPGGYVRSLVVQETANQCNYVDAVPMTEAVFRGILQNMQNCRCHPPTGTPDGDLDNYLYYYYEYDAGDSDPELRPATSAIDLPFRPKDRAFAIFEGNVWLWPVLNSTDTAVLKWHGVKKNWRDTDIMPWLDEKGEPDYEVQEAVQWYFQSKRYQYDLCDMEKASASMSVYHTKRAEMMVECKRKAALPQLVHVIPNCGC